jgi:nitroimidazol reductase NimA-like FMN-containing flavoprotein (pyridoxamine 5'-phosphate oxidase superfamily)
MPKGYGIQSPEKGMLSWAEVTERLAAARNYWVSTTRPDGRPHVMSVWGVWIDGTFFFGTDGTSRKARNLAKNAAIAVHLESGDDVVILEGTAREMTHDSELVTAIDAAYQVKYGMRLSDCPGVPFVCAVEPRVAFAWREKDYPSSATRWLL